MLSKTLLIALTASLALHAIAVFSFYPEKPQEKPVEKNALIISHMVYPQNSPSADPRTASNASVSKPVPQAVEAKPRKKHQGIKPTYPPEPVVQNSGELLTDPQKGKVFYPYFETIKEKIHQTVQKKYAALNPGEGVVSMVFILRSDGALDSAVIVSKDSQAGPAVQNFAVECIKESAPFAAFPKELLGFPKISFNVTLLFNTV